MFKRLIASLVCITFSCSNFQYAQAQDFNVNQLPVPGTMVGESAPFAPLALKGLIVNPQKPLEFQFIVDTGNGPQDTASVKDQANQLVKYFLAGLTIPEGDLWVNLSPYEKNRMVPEALGQTDLGRDLLAQDYILKQLTASLIYPEKDLGKEFWNRVYAKAQTQFGTTNVPVNTFNKVWILPNEAQVFENVNAAYVTKSTLKVMLDEDYLAKQKHQSVQAASISSQIVRQIVLPEIEKEVNTGKNFAPLRQIYQALILSKWYKETIQNGLLEAVYTNKKKVAGVNVNDPKVKEEIYQRYLKAYKKGTFNYIKEDPTPNGQLVPRKYFSGGFTELGMKLDRTGSPAMISADGAMVIFTLRLVTVSAALGTGGLILKSRMQRVAQKRAETEILQKQNEFKELAREVAGRIGLDPLIAQEVYINLGVLIKPFIENYLIKTIRKFHLEATHEFSHTMVIDSTINHDIFIGKSTLRESGFKNSVSDFDNHGYGVETIYKEGGRKLNEEKFFDFLSTLTDENYKGRILEVLKQGRIDQAMSITPIQTQKDAASLSDDLVHIMDAWESSGRNVTAEQRKELSDVLAQYQSDIERLRQWESGIAILESRKFKNVSDLILFLSQLPGMGGWLAQKAKEIDELKVWLDVKSNKEVNFLITNLKTLLYFLGNGGAIGSDVRVGKFPIGSLKFRIRFDIDSHTHINMADMLKGIDSAMLQTPNKDLGMLRIGNAKGSQVVDILRNQLKEKGDREVSITLYYPLPTDKEVASTELLSKLIDLFQENQKPVVSSGRGDDLRVVVTFDNYKQRNGITPSVYILQKNLFPDAAMFSRKAEMIDLINHYQKIGDKESLAEILFSYKTFFGVIDIDVRNAASNALNALDDPRGLLVYRFIFTKGHRTLATVRRDKAMPHSSKQDASMSSSKFHKEWSTGRRRDSAFNMLYRANSIEEVSRIVKDNQNNPNFINIKKVADLRVKQLLEKKPNPSGLIIPIKSNSNDHAMNGGIDLNQIGIKRTGHVINVQFDQAQLTALEQGDFEGFTPVITDMERIQSPLPLLGVGLIKHNEQLAKV